MAFKVSPFAAKASERRIKLLRNEIELFFVCSSKYIFPSLIFLQFNFLILAYIFSGSIRPISKGLFLVMVPSEFTIFIGVFMGTNL